jgi:hypothetical protein
MVRTAPVKPHVPTSLRTEQDDILHEAVGEEDEDDGGHAGGDPSSKPPLYKRYVYKDLMCLPGPSFSL